MHFQFLMMFLYVIGEFFLSANSIPLAFETNEKDVGVVSIIPNNLNKDETSIFRGAFCPLFESLLNQSVNYLYAIFSNQFQSRLTNNLTKTCIKVKQLMPNPGERVNITSNIIHGIRLLSGYNVQKAAVLFTNGEFVDDSLVPVKELLALNKIKMIVVSFHYYPKLSALTSCIIDLSRPDFVNDFKRAMRTETNCTSSLNQYTKQTNYEHQKLNQILLWFQDSNLARRLPNPSYEFYDRPKLSIGIAFYAREITASSIPLCMLKHHFLIILNMFIHVFHRYDVEIGLAIFDIKIETTNNFIFLKNMIENINQVKNIERNLSAFIDDSVKIFEDTNSQNSQNYLLVFDERDLNLINKYNSYYKHKLIKGKHSATIIIQKEIDQENKYDNDVDDDDDYFFTNIFLKFFP
jgi:hypothetical protein